MNISFDEARDELGQAQTAAMWPFFLPGFAAPETLHHYTNAAGLQGILKSKSLWASDWNFLNDRSELVYSHNLIRDFTGRPRSTRKHRFTSHRSVRRAIC